MNIGFVWNMDGNDSCVILYQLTFERSLGEKILFGRLTCDDHYVGIYNCMAEIRRC